MRRTLIFSAFFLLISSPGVCAQEHSGQGQNQPDNPANAPDQAQAQAASQAPHEPSPTITSARGSRLTEPQPAVSLGDAARKAREAKKATKPARVFTNDDLAAAGPISTVGGTASTSGSQADNSGASSSEKEWRKKFSDLHSKLDRDQQALDVMQRELGVLSVQYYNDPVKAMQQQYSRSNINDQNAAIDKKKQEVAADRRDISDAEDDLKKAGGDPGWAR